MSETGYRWLGVPIWYIGLVGDIRSELREESPGVFRSWSRMDLYSGGLKVASGIATPSTAEVKIPESARYVLE